MNLSEILLSIVAAAATLTPLILGLLKYFGDKKEAPEAVVAAAPVATLGDSVDFESVAVTGLNRHIDSLQGQLERLGRDLDRKQDELDRAHAALKAAGLPTP